jgi:signal transduction histidine kinase
MRYRARLIGAALEAGAAAAGGTCIRCTLPLPITS